jgi:hypothetical protein
VVVTVDLDFGSLDGPPPAHPMRPGRRHRWVAAGALLAVLVVAAGGYVWSQHRPAAVPVTIRGTMILTDARTLQANCVGQGVFSDLRTGATVVLTDESGRRIASAHLQPGESDFDDQVCSYPFTLTRVPSDHQQYAVEVADRGRVTKSRAEMAQSGWTYFLSLT